MPPSRPVINGKRPTRPATSRSTNLKRKQSSDDAHPSARRFKKTKVEPGSHHVAIPSLNKAPTDVLAVFVFGNGDAGELGLGPAIQEAGRPRLNPFLKRVVQLSCGGQWVVTWGVNDNGALGRSTDWHGGLRDIDGDADRYGELSPLESVPTEIPDHSFPPGTMFVQVAAGDSCSFALTDTGLVYGWGTFKNSKGKERFGFDTNNGKLIEKQPTPTLIPSLSNITQIACGANHALALSSNGLIWSWGCGEQGQLARHDTDLNYLVPDPIHIRDIKYIASGEYHSSAVDKKENVWAWGLNSFGQTGYAKAAGSDEVCLPYPMKIRDLAGCGIEHLAGGAHHSAALTADGQCFVWGRLDGGQLGIAFTPEQLQDSNLIRYDERNKPRICLRPTPVLGIGRFSHVACGTDHTIFVTRKEGTAYATGFNSQDQLELGHEDDVEVAQLIKGKDLKDRKLIWAGAGGQFSVVAALSNSKAT